MFAYCNNNPVMYSDSQGYLAAAFYDNDGEMFSSDEFEERNGGASSWTMFLQTLDAAMSGLTAPGNRKNYSGSENHHIASNKNTKYSPQYKEITEKYNFSLSQKENIIPLPGHRGRHTTAYLDYIVTGLTAADVYANGNQDQFIQALGEIGKRIIADPWLPYARYGGK